MMYAKEMTGTSRSLCEAYWKLQREVHTNPGVRPYLTSLSGLLRERGIHPRYLNDVGLEMAVQEMI